MDGWLAFSQIEPFGEDRADLRSAIATTAVCNAFGADCDVEDFMPFLDDDDADYDEDDEAAAELEAWNQQQAISRIVARHNAGQGKDA